MLFKRDEVTLPFSAGIPTDRYTVRIISASKAKSQSGNDMIVTKLEIVYPEDVQTERGRIMIAGKKHTIYTILDPTVPWGIGAMIQGLEKAGFDFTKMTPSGDFDDSKLGVLAEFCFDMVLSSRKDIARYPLTPEDVKAGLKEGRPILDKDGNEILKGYIIEGDWSNVVGPASYQPSSPVWNA